MAVYTDITETELRDFLEPYDIGELLSYKGIAEGVENSNFLVHTSAGSYILTLYEKRVDRNDLPFFLGLMEHLAQNGLTCPLPVHRRDGIVLGTLAGRPAAVISFLEGMWPRKPTPMHCREVGKAAAVLHVSGRGFQRNRANALSVGAWRALWDQSASRADEVEAGLGAEIQTDLDHLEGNWPQGLPSGVIHADLFPDNVFFLGEELSGVIDFYFACNDLFAYDIAICLNAWCFERDGAFNVTKGMALLDGYQSVRPLSGAEADALPLLAHGAALRFFLTRLYDWLTVPDGAMVVKKDPREYLRYLRFHRKIGSAGEYGLRMGEAG
ncbi:homoserine kinase [Hoeflea prorocentri]|uniref:Homoserine kinase n=1 Tax=Hoeflea prorocentri TaxID=1922333 RepID=A0A9X3UJC4_9HYPH|nr:homoserine kinase [Hoeflea prorocentri]MCY6381656.1 homoserine kinase [Hoeflea prorocentri]MDA5399456.1 homoserine kinase [Hoeflea prorocentri]